jgi:hypothetical protein
MAQKITNSCYAYVCKLEIYEHAVLVSQEYSKGNLLNISSTDF